MWATISRSPLSSSTAIAVTSPPPFEKSISARGSMGGPSLPPREGCRQTRAQLAQVVEARAAREAGLAVRLAPRRNRRPLQHAEPDQEIHGVREGDRVRRLAPLRLAEQHGARELL